MPSLEKIWKVRDGVKIENPNESYVNDFIQLGFTSKKLIPIICTNYVILNGGFSNLCITVLLQRCICVQCLTYDVEL